MAPPQGGDLMVDARDTTLRVASSNAGVAARCLNHVIPWGGRNAGVIALVLLWQILTMWANSFLFPTPVTIATTAASIWLSPDASHFFLSDAVFVDIIPSLARLLLGWSVAVVLGTTLGLVIGRFQRLSDAVHPALEFLRALPSPALIPVFLVLLGTGPLMRVTLIVLGSVWPILLNSIEGFQTVDRGHIEMAKIFRLPASARLFRVVIPSAAPQIFAGMRISLAIAIILMVVSELVASSSGIGHAIIDAQATFQLAVMWANIVLLAVIGIVLDGLFSTFENRVLNWHHAAMRIAQ
jgi:ABC-type nitrate/sulfonate/bicarbonate transport system permease component